jgi:hypothetical protein
MSKNVTGTQMSEKGTAGKSNPHSVSLSGDLSENRNSKSSIPAIAAPTPNEAQNPKPQPQPKNYGVSVSDYMKEDFKLPKMSKQTKERIGSKQLTKEEVDQFDKGILRYLEKHSKKKEVSTPTPAS